MKRQLLTVLCLALTLCAVASPPPPRAEGRASFKTSGRMLREAPGFRSDEKIQRIPTKGEVYGSGPIQGQSLECPSVTLPADSLMPVAAPRLADGDGPSVLALLIFCDTEKTANKIIRLPATAGAVDDFAVVAENVPVMPYKRYGEQIVNGVAFDDKFMASTFCSMIYSQTNSVFDATTWQNLYNYDYRRADLEIASVTYSDADGICYGVFQGINPSTGQEEWFFGRWIDPGSYTQPETIAWLGADTKWYGIAASPDGALFAIDNNCNLLKVNKTDGSTTLVGATGLSNQYKTSACYDAANGRILFATSLDMGSAMNAIDPATGRATMLYLMPHGEQIVGMYMDGVRTPDKAPAAPQNLASDFPLGSMTGNIRFDVPALHFDGTEARGAVSYEVIFNGERVGTGTANYGTSVSAQVTVPSSGEAVVAVRLSNSSGKSPFVRSTLFCGSPVPRAPYFDKAVEYDAASGEFSISWSDNSDSSGQTGGTVAKEDLTYELVRYPDGKVISVDIGVHSYVDSYVPESDNLELVYYTLCSVYYGQKSYQVISNATRLGVINPPYEGAIDSRIASAAFTTLTTSGDTRQWEYIGPVVEQERQHGWMYHGAANSSTSMDSYLVTSPVNLQKGKVYTLSFTAACTNTSWRNERLAVYMGKEISEEGLREMTLMEPTLIYSRREEDGERHSCNFTAPDDGLYYIGFHHNSDPNLRFLYIGELAISAPKDGAVPAAVSDLSVKAAPAGELKATLSFTLPVNSVNGSPLTEPTGVRIFREGEQIADLTPSGNACEYEDASTPNGVVNYVVTPYNSKGDGLSAMANVFVGVGKPDMPRPYAWYGATDGEARVTWNAVAADEFGTPLNSFNVRYEIQRERQDGSAIVRNLIGEDIRELYFRDKFCDDDAEQTPVSYWVRSVTDGGNSVWHSTRRVGLGKPYQAPFFESFAGATAAYNWNTIGSDMAWNIVDDSVFDDVKSVDGDNGFLVAQASSAGTAALLYSGCIEIPEDMENPVYSFYYLNQDKYHGQPVKNTLDLVILDSEAQKHSATIVVDGEWGWQRVSYDMSAYKGKKVETGVYIECIDRPYMAFDAFSLATRYSHDIGMVRLSGPEKVAAGQNAVLTLTYENVGSEDIPAGYSVQLYRGGELLAEVPGELLTSDGRASCNFTVETNPTLGSAVSYHAVVKCDADDFRDNNTSNILTLQLTNNIGYPEPRSLTARRSDEGVALVWTEPDMSRTPRKIHKEDFESFDSFAKEIPGWTIVDEDGGIVAPVSSYIQTAETWGSPFGFFVQDNSVAPFSSYTEFGTTSGCKYMASQHTVNEYGSSVQNKDWLISPELSGDEQVASFMGKSISSSWPESFEVYYSTTGTDLSDFLPLGGVSGAPSVWVNYTVSLPQGAKYFAIRCTSIACLQFMVDDVELRLKSCEPMELTLQGYNIYRDGTPVNDTPVGAKEFLDTDADRNEHRYQVTALYAQGESLPSEASTVQAGIDNPDAPAQSVIVRNGSIIVRVPDTTAVEIYNVAGVRLHNGCGPCSVSVLPGVYVIRLGNRSLKVIVE